MSKIVEGAGIVVKKLSSCFNIIFDKLNAFPNLWEKKREWSAFNQAFI